MKKRVTVFMAMVLMMVMVAPAMAESNLTITGSYDIWGMSADGVNAQNNRVDETDSDERNYFYQRFRVQPQFKASDNVTANLRFDFAEGLWGQDQNFSTARASYDSGSDIQVDRAYVDIDTQWAGIRAGLQFIPVGQGQVFRDNQPALQFNIKTGSPLDVRLGWVKVDEGISALGSSTDRLNDEGEYEDTDRYIGEVTYKMENMKINLFYVTQIDGSSGEYTDPDTDEVTNDYEDQPWVAGLHFQGDFGVFSCHGEAAQFGGDNGNNVDYTGTQVNVNGKYNLSDALSLGLDLFYSSAQGDDEKKITSMGNPFAAYDIRYGGSMGWDTLTWARANNHLYSSTPPGGPLPGDVFDPFNTGAGSIGAGIGAMYLPMEKLTLIGQFHYMTADDDDISGVTGEFENGSNLLLAAVYQLAPNTSLHAVYQRVDASFMDDVDPDASYLCGLGIHVTF